MTIACRVSWPHRRAMATVLASVCLVFATARAEAGPILIPAWSFARGNGRIHASPEGYADAGPVVRSGPREPWGWTVEYDVDLPVEAKYTLQIRYAAAEARPVEVVFDGELLPGKACNGVTFGKSDQLTWNSSGAKWEGVRNQWGRLIAVSATKGVHTVKLIRRGPLPHLAALRLDTPTAFPEGWSPPRHTVRDLDSIPAAQRQAFEDSDDVTGGPIEEGAPPKARGKLEIPAWSFDRGKAVIYASPDHYADAGPIVGSGQEEDAGQVEYDIEFPVAAEYTLHISYAAAEARPVEVFLDGRRVGRCCTGIAFGSAPFERPVRFTWNSSGALKNWEALREQGKLVRLSIGEGKHTLKLSRRGPLPHLATLRLETTTAFPKGWKQSPRTVRDIESIPVTERSVFLPPGVVNVPALRLAIEDTIRTFGPQYPNGEQYLTRLTELDKQQDDAALKALRRETMLAHPALKFDKLLFVKRTPFKFNTYQDSKSNTEGGSLCVLSPVSADGTVTSLVPELDGGIFSRFDLSFDAKKIVFGYKKKDEPFRIYEIDIDPATGQMAPGSLRQLTLGSDAEAEATRLYGDKKWGADHGFDDMDPCYLPNGKIMFASTRSMRRVFCNPSIVTTLHLMDGDGKNVRCISGGPLNEIDPCLLADGRVVYTRWEYVDKGLGNGQSLWTVRPDGSGVDHLYKNSIIRPAQLLHTRNIPGSRRVVTVGAPHCGGRQGGPVILVDYAITRRSPEAMTCITPEIAYPCMNQATWDRGFFREPYPFSEKFFLVSHCPPPRGSHYGIYVLDQWGNRALLYRDETISCFQPTPLRPRRRPADIAPVGPEDGRALKTGTLFVQDVYQGMTGIERGRVKYLRVMGALPWPWDAEGIFRVGMHGNVHRKKVYGIAKVHEDGSACFTVPAGENVFFQALDENYMQLQHMPTFINLMPGESRSCIGCHESRSKTPSYKLAMALRRPPQALSPQPGETGPLMVHYASYVQPVLDKRCVGCHGSENPEGRLDLTGEATKSWTRSYENLVGRGLVSVRDCRYGRAGFVPEAPLSYGSHLSKLAERVRTEPCGADLTDAERIRILTWIDANSPFLGTYGEHGGIGH